MFERFTDHARRVLVLAQEESRLLNHEFVGTEHLLLGLLHQGDGVAAHALESLGISLAVVREQVGEIVGVAAGHPGSGEAPFTPRAKKVLELSMREARQLGHDQIGPEHLLLGVVREGEGVAVQVLVNLGADPGRVRQRVLGRMSGEEYPHPTVRVSKPGPGRAWLEAREMRDLPPPGRCSVCGRDLWETAHFAVGGHGRVCEECLRAASRLLDAAVVEQRELVLPPRVSSGQSPDDEAVEAIVMAIERTFGPTAGPATWATTLEDPERFEPLLQ